jgi:hypothetical protein
MSISKKSQRDWAQHYEHLKFSQGILHCWCATDGFNVSCYTLKSNYRAEKEKETSLINRKIQFPLMLQPFKVISVSAARKYLYNDLH